MHDSQNGTSAPTTSVVRVALVSVPKDGEASVRFISEWQRCLTHWMGKRSLPCAGVDKCPRKRHEEPVNWRAYAAVELWLPAPASTWSPGVLEITESLGDLLEGRKLIGEVWRLFRRPTAGKRRECYGQLVEVGRPAPIVPTLWIETVLFRLWGTLDVEWGAEQIKPPPLKVSTRSAPPPAATNVAPEADRPCSSEQMRAFTRRAREVLEGKRAARQ